MRCLATTNRCVSVPTDRHVYMCVYVLVRSSNAWHHIKHLPRMVRFLSLHVYVYLCWCTMKNGVAQIATAINIRVQRHENCYTTYGHRIENVYLSSFSSFIVYIVYTQWMALLTATTPISTPGTSLFCKCFNKIVNIYCNRQSMMCTSIGLRSMRNTINILFRLLASKREIYKFHKQHARIHSTHIYNGQSKYKQDR